MIKLDNFITVKPNFELQKYVDSYYFHSCDDIRSDLNYTYYPHIKHAVTVYKDSIAQTNGNLTIVKPLKSSFSVLYSTVIEGPHKVVIKGNFKKIGIVFKPYGLNHFINKSINDFHNQTISNFKEWNPQFQKVVEKIWETNDLRTRTVLLNSFLNSQKINRTDEVFSTLIDEIINMERVESIQNLSERFHLSRKTLYRMFNSELNYSPSKFLKILRFRKSLETYLETDKMNLTEVAVAQFYDQSDFIKNVRQIATTTPRRFKKEVSDLENTIFWKIG